MEDSCDEHNGRVIAHFRSSCCYVADQNNEICILIFQSSNTKKTATIGCLQGRVASDMGCTPSIHLSQTGVVYCRETAEDCNSPHPAALNATFQTAHPRILRSSSMVTTPGISKTDKEFLLTTTPSTSAFPGSTAASLSLSSSLSSRVGGGKPDKSSLSGEAWNAGSLTLSSPEAETSLGRQSMKVSFVFTLYIYVCGRRGCGCVFLGERVDVSLCMCVGGGV